MKRLGLCTVAALALTASAEARELRFAHWLPPQHPFQQGVEKFAEDLKAASNGELTVAIFPAGQLGAPNDHYDLAKSGAADFSWITIGYAPGQFPVAELVDIPFMVQGDAHKATRAFNEWYMPYAAKEMPDVKVCFVHLGPAGTINTKEAVVVPKDIEGLRVRPAGAAVSAYISNIGGSPVPVPATEARQAIERGVADAITFPLNSLVLFGIDEVVTHHLDSQMYFAAAAVLMNQSTYDGLSDSEKAAVDQVCSTDEAEKFAAPWQNWEMEGKAALEAKDGHTFHELTAEELTLWQDAAKPQVEAWREAVTAKGYNPDDLQNGLAAALKAEGAN